MAQRFVTILAGGEGSRVRAWTRSPGGTPVPKQFCRLSDGRSLLGRALDRARALAPEANILAVVRSAHRAWWERELADLPRENVLEETLNRGTAVAVLRALVEVLSRDEEALLIVLPSDHHVADERAMLRAIARLADEAERWQYRTVLLGIECEGDGRDLGWIVPAGPLLGATRGVGAFVEKPCEPETALLRRRGAVVNSFIFASRGAALLDLYEVHLPELFLLLGEFGWPHGAPAGAEAHAGRARDFSRDLLQAAASRLRVLTAPPCGWVDLGTPRRLETWLQRSSEAFIWDEEPAPAEAAIP